MSGAEGIIALGVVSSIITCIDISFKVAKRLDFYLSRTKQPPQIFISLHDQIPLLVKTYEEIKGACEKAKISPDQQTSLLKTVQGCVRLTTSLETHFEECLSLPDDSFLRKGKKALKSIKVEKYIVEIQRTLDTYKSTLTLYFSHLTAMAASDQSLSSLGADVKFYEVPAVRVNHFVGRKHLLDRMHNHFEDGSMVVVLFGMGGQGKSQLSLEYLKQHRASNSIFWVDATSAGTANRGFELIASNLTPGSIFPNPEAARAHVIRTFNGSPDPVLMVFDNFDNPTVFPSIRDFLSHRAKVIFTSRHADAKRLGQSIEVGALSLDEGVELLLLQSGYDQTNENIEDARQIVESLGGLALAIDQAATYIGARHVPLKSFPEVYAKRGSAILKYTPSHWEYSTTRLEELDKPLSVFTTWEMSFEQLQGTEAERESLVHLLTLGAFIDTRDVSEGLFRLYATENGSPKLFQYFMNDSQWDGDKYQDSLVRLLSVSLVTSIDIMAADARFSFHPLIAEWLKLRINDTTRRQYTDESIQVVRFFIDNGDKRDMPIRDKMEILNHLDAVIAHEEMLRSHRNQISLVLQDAVVSFGSFYRRLGRYHEARNLIQRALDSNQEAIPTIKNVLANMYCDLGNLDEAESIYTQVLINLHEPPPAKDPTEKLHTTRLGFLYWTQDDKLDSSGTEYHPSFTGTWTHNFEPWFLSRMSAKNGLAITHIKAGRLSTASKLLSSALRGREEASGLSDRYTLDVVNHLGAVKTLQGDYTTAEQLFLRALAGLEKNYGADYMNVQYICCNLGLCYLCSGQLEKAEHMLERAARDLEGGFGAGHPSTLTTVHNQGLLYLQQEQGKSDAVQAARAKFERAVAGWEAIGEGVAKSKSDSKYCLATVYEMLEDKKGDAEVLFREAAELCEQALGKTHPQTRETYQKAEEARDSVKRAEEKIN